MSSLLKMCGLDLTKRAHSVEFSVVDPKNKTLELKSRNYTLMDYIVVDETLKYSPDPNNESSTLLHQEWKINCEKLMFTSKLESAMGSSFLSNAPKGRAGIEFVIKTIRSEVEKLNFDDVTFVGS